MAAKAVEGDRMIKKLQLNKYKTQMVCFYLACLITFNMSLFSIAAEPSPAAFGADSSGGGGPFTLSPIELDEADRMLVGFVSESSPRPLELYRLIAASVLLCNNNKKCSNGDPMLNPHNNMLIAHKMYDLKRILYQYPTNCTSRAYCTGYANGTLSFIPVWFMSKNFYDVLTTLVQRAHYQDEALMINAIRYIKNHHEAVMNWVAGSSVTNIRFAIAPEEQRIRPFPNE